MKVRYITAVDEIGKTNILFISNSENKNLKNILEYTNNKPILTIGESKGFAEKGVLINFYLSENKVRFEINESAVRETGLYMSFRLLSLAKIVNPIDN